MKTLVLLSGGIDSAGCVSFYLGLGHQVEALYIDYGQAASRAERAAASLIARHFSIPFRTLLLQGPPVRFSGEIIGRNAFLLFAALLYRPSHHGIIAIGIHDDSNYYDCQKSFVRDIQRIFSGYADGKVFLGTPFLSWTKDMIWQFCNQNNVPIQLTWSCEVGPDSPCRNCLSCREIEALHARSE